MLQSRLSRNCLLNLLGERTGETSANVQTFFGKRPIVIRRFFMPPHIRRCVECPQCLTRYLIGFSPYRNGAYLVSTEHGSAEEYTLYCACRRPVAPSRWRARDLKSYTVSKEAHDRGFGTCEEIAPVSGRLRPAARAGDSLDGSHFPRRTSSE